MMAAQSVTKASGILWGKQAAICRESQQQSEPAGMLFDETKGLSKVWGAFCTGTHRLQSAPKHQGRAKFMVHNH